MPRDLQADQQMLRQVLALAERRDIAAAAALAAPALAEGFDHPLLLNVVATQLEEQGRYPEALQLLERALRLSPGDLGVRNALALCLLRLERPAEALFHFDELLKARPDLAFAHANRGNTLIALGELAQAKQSHLRALELEPDNLAAKAALAAIASHRGAHDEARGWAREVLKVVPGLPDAVMSLAAAELASGATDQAQLLVCQLLADPRAGLPERARAQGMLGDILDAAGQYPQAFEAYMACNESLRQLHRRHGEEGNILGYTRALVAALDAVPPEAWVQTRDRARGPEATVPSEAHLQAGSGHAFLVGFPRSGTTLLEAVLDGHPRVVSLEEHELLTEGVLHYMREPLDLAPLLRAGEGELQALRAAYWRHVAAAGVDPRGKVFVDKYPLNTLKLPLIARLFPEAKILFACRDPRDVVLGCFRRRFTMNTAMYQLLTLPGAAAFYDATLQLAELARPRLGMAWKVVRYESLVDDLAAQLQDIAAFLGLEAVTGLEDFAARIQARERATPSTAQLAQGLNRSGVGHWRHYRAELAPILPQLAPWVERLGYAKE